MLRFGLVTTTILYLLSVSVADTLGAQAVAGHAGNDTVHLRNDCRLADQILTHGQPANKRGWALWAIQRCGAEGGRTLAGIIERYKGAAVRLPVVEDALNAAVGFQDRALLEAGLAVARDAGASETGRIQAMRLLFTQVEPESFGPWEWFVNEDGREPETLIDLGVRHGAPLPLDYLQRIIAAMREVESSPGNSFAVRKAAERVRLSAAAAERRGRCAPTMSARECAEASRAQP